jgi:hypothetical protein
MSRLRVAVVLLVMVTAACWPSAASAESDVLAWFEGLSGPGPFNTKARGFEINAACIPLNSGCYASDGVDGRGDAKWLFKFGVSWAETGPAQLFQDDTLDVRNVKERVITTMVMYRASRVVDAGFGVHFINFSSSDGAAFDFSRTAFVPARLSVTPFGALTASGRWKGAPRVIHLQAEGIWFKDGFNGGDFKNTRTKFSTGSEYQTRLAILFDVGSLLWGAIR